MDIRSIFKGGHFDEIDPKNYKKIILALVSVIMLMVASAVVAFFLALQGEERTLVPDVSGMELSNALIRLQEKELYPRVSLRFSDDPESRGRILEQSPLPGSIVKAGRRISLVVSRGAAQDRIGAYVGQNLEELKLQLQAIFASTRQLITVKEPPVYVYDPSPAGTVLQQDPPPETEISDAVELTLVVSRGPERALMRVPELVGLDLRAAAALIERSGVNFEFSVRGAEGRERAGTVVSQLPAPGSLVDHASPVAVVFALPAAQAGLVTGLFSQELPEYPYPLRISLVAVAPNGQRSALIAADHPGKLFTMPYAVPAGTVLELQVSNRVVARREAGR